MRARISRQKGEVQKQGKPWKRMGIFKFFEDADEKRNELLKYSNDEFQVKVKRCGISGKQFVVKLRYLL